VSIGIQREGRAGVSELLRDNFRRLILFFCPRRPRARRPSLPQKGLGLATVRPHGVTPNRSRGYESKRRRAFSISATAVGTDESEECQGDSPAQVRPPRHRVARRNERKTQVYGVRVCAPRLALFFCPRRPRARRPSLPQKGRGLARPASGRDERDQESFHEMNRIKTPLYHFNHCFQCVAKVNTNFLNRLDQSGVT
jgi:hypothetical protein